MVVLTGWWVSTLPFLQRDVINGDVSLDAWSPDTFEYHLESEKQKTSLSYYIFRLEGSTKTRKLARLKNKIEKYTM